MRGAEGVSVSFRLPQHGNPTANGLCMPAAGSAPRGAAGGDPPAPRPWGRVGSGSARSGARGRVGIQGTAPSPTPLRVPSRGEPGDVPGIASNLRSALTCCGSSAAQRAQKLLYPLNAPGSQWACVGMGFLGG